MLPAASTVTPGTQIPDGSLVLAGALTPNTTGMFAGRWASADRIDRSDPAVRTANLKSFAAHLRWVAAGLAALALVDGMLGIARLLRRELAAVRLACAVVEVASRAPKQLRILEAFDAVGGNLNAYTAKETTVFHARILDRDLPMAVAHLDRKSVV